MQYVYVWPCLVVGNAVEVIRCPACDKRGLISFGQVPLIGVGLPEDAERLRKLKRCLRCGSFVVDTIPDYKLLQQYYENYQSHVDDRGCHKGPSDWLRRDELQLIVSIAQHMGKGCVPDIGCGDKEEI